MGWTSYHSERPVNRKDIMDKQCTWVQASVSGEQFGTRILKSTMVASTYYAAVEEFDETKGERRVFAVVGLTTLSKNSYFNFSYKITEENEGPNEAECPIGILNLLTPTDNMRAMRWRERCREHNKLTNSEDALNKLPLGSIIECVWCGEKISLVKRRPTRQFKTPWWQVCGKSEYIPKSQIPNEYTVLVKGEGVA